MSTITLKHLKKAPSVPAPAPAPVATTKPGAWGPSKFDTMMAWINLQFNVPLENPLLQRYPFAIGIAEELVNHPKLKATANPAAILATLGEITRTLTYKNALANPGRKRFGLYGVEKGEVDEDIRAGAEALVQEQRARRAAKKEG